MDRSCEQALARSCLPVQQDGRHPSARPETWQYASNARADLPECGTIPENPPTLARHLGSMDPFVVVRHLATFRRFASDSPLRLAVTYCF
jgi:hypothetical protein